MASVLPTPVKTWTLVKNQSMASSGVLATDTNVLMLALINQLITWGWTISGSGSTAYGGGANDSTNRIASTANMSVGCWITLYNSAMGLYLQIQQHSATSGQWIFRGSYAGFSGGSPSATVAGTAADSFNANIQNGFNTPFCNIAFGSTCKWHGWKSSDNYVHRIVVYVSSVPTFFLHLEKAVNAPAGFPAAVAAVLDQGASSTTNKILLAGLHWYSYYAAARADLGVMQVTVAGTTGPALANPGVFDSNWAILPLGCGSVTAAIYGPAFWFADLWLVATSLQEAATFPASGARQFVVCGDLVLPWDDTAMQVT